MVLNCDRRLPKKHTDSIVVEKSARGLLGKIYNDGEYVIRENDIGNCMYVIQEGKVKITSIRNGKEMTLATIDKGEFFGEMSIFEDEMRSANVKAAGKARILTVDKSTLLQRVSDDPTLAFYLIKSMSHRIRNINTIHSKIRSVDRRNWETREERTVSGKGTEEKNVQSIAS